MTTLAVTLVQTTCVLPVTIMVWEDLERGGRQPALATLQLAMGPTDTLGESEIVYFICV